MRRLIPALFVAALALGGYWWWQTDGGDALKGSGVVVAEPREVGGFAAIDLSGAGTLRIVQGDAETLTVRTDDNILPLIVTEVRDDTLRISIDTHEHRHGIDPTELSYEVGVKTLSRIAVFGATRIETAALATDDLRLQVSGAAEFELAGLMATNLRVTCTGGGRFTLAGAVDNQDVTIDGAGEYWADDLVSRSATVEINGAGRVVVRVAETLDVTINGTGDVEYIGEPTVDRHIEGVGSIRRIER